MMLGRATSIVISLSIVPFRTSLHVLRMQMSIFVCNTNIRILLLLSYCKEVSLCIIALIRHRLAVLTLLLGPHV